MSEQEYANYLLAIDNQQPMRGTLSWDQWHNAADAIDRMVRLNPSWDHVDAE